jgi:hypothetical protein
MSYLDNLENSLKSLENQEERDTSIHERREAERAGALAIAPWAEKLKDSRYTKELMDRAVEAGHRIRAKVYMTWLGSTFRLEVRSRKLELRPTSQGIAAVFIEDNNEESKSHSVDLESNPSSLIEEWLG